MKQIVINADDLGICESTNTAISRAHQEGVLTSASIMANGIALDDAVSRVVKPCANLGIGIHICLTSGRSILNPKQIPLLVNDSGYFRRGFLALCTLVARNPRALQQIESEIDAQFCVLKEHGIVVDHVNSHRHVHMIPGIFRVVARAAAAHKCGVIRVSREALRPAQHLKRPATWFSLCGNTVKKLVLGLFAIRHRNYLDGLVCCTETMGILGSGRMDRTTLCDSLNSVGDGITEIITHPGTADPTLWPKILPMERRFLEAPHRSAELEALMDGTLRQRIIELGIELTSFRQLFKNTANQAADSEQLV